MKRWIVVSIGVVAVVVIIAAAALWMHTSTMHTSNAADTHRHTVQTDNNTAANNTKNEATQTQKPQPATCAELLTAAQATRLLGGKPKLGSTNGTPNTASPHVTINTCTYTNSKTSQIIRVVAYTANDPAGVSDNVIVFRAGKPKDAVTVTGYGDAAFWEQNSGVLNILLHNNWYEISNGAGESTTIEQAEQVARVVLGNL